MKKENPPCNPEIDIDFSTFIYSLGTTALMSLGVIPNPVTSEMKEDIATAKQNIDILGLLQEKTKGNLSEEEEKTLAAILLETRTKYCEISKNQSIKL
jgi:hypothetical protein